MKLPTWFVRQVTYPAHERLRGRSTLHELRILRQLATATPATVQRDVTRRLRELLSFTAAKLPYYANGLTAAGVDLRADDLEAELRKLPILDKTDIRSHRAELVWSEVPGGLVRHSSGGTTGDAVHFFIDRVRQAQDLAARLFMQSLFGMRLGDRRLHLWGSRIEATGHRLRRWRDGLLNERLVSAFELAPADLDAHLRRILAFEPAVLYGYPTAVALLAEHAARSHAPRRIPGLRLVVLTGEEITESQMAIIRSTFGCAVAAEYGSREVGLVAHDCPSGRMHILAPHVHVDIAVAGKTMPAGACGDVICTTLNTRAQPFVRYRVGDVGRLLAESCPCGLPFPTMRLEGGKITGFIALPGGRLCHGALTSHVLRSEPGIRAFRTHQRALNDFEVLLVVDNDFSPATIERIRERYRALFGPQVRVQCRLVEAIPPDPSGKRRYVVSDVAARYSAFAAAPTRS